KPRRGLSVGRGRVGVWQCAASLLALAACGLLALRSHAAEPSREYQVKAVFLFNFAQFTEWPSNAFASADSPIYICTLGNNPFGDYLQQIVRNEAVRGRKLVIEHHQKVEEIKTCHILYIGQSEAERQL